uniref:Carboxylesterase type B domain-containing protein n=1 Tax=Arion vulgaris TaxID=1028688 RepID=A0A0B7AAK6_9EUPU
MTPRVERRFGFLPDYPKRLLERGAFNRVDTLRGYNSGEYSYFVTDPENNGLSREEFSSNFERFYGKYLLQRHAHDFLSQFIYREYLGSNTNPISIRSNLVTAFADTGFGLGSVLEAQKMLEHGGAGSNHFVYEMDYQNSLSNHPTWMGVIHAEELPLVFMSTFPVPSIFLNQADRVMGEKVQTMWTNFVKTGNPVATQVVENGVDVRWNKYTLTNPIILKIDVRSSEVPFPRPASLRAYDEFLNVLQETSPAESSSTTSSYNLAGNTPVLG